MIPQELVEAHAARIDAVVDAFAQQISVEVELVVEAVASHIFRTLQTKDGVVDQTVANASEIRMMDSVFIRALNASSYYASVQSFVSEFSNQVDGFEQLYGEMRKGTSLPAIIFVDEDRAILTAQAGAALAAIEGQTLLVTYDIRQLSSRYMGGIDISELVQGVSDSIRKLSNVKLVARDQLIVFFRLIGNLVYQNVENSGHRITYSYVGPDDDRNRSFCSTLIGSGDHTRAEIGQMDNGQLAGVFENAGGFGCRHWWEATS